MDDNRLIELAREVLTVEARAIEALIPRLGSPFLKATHECLNCRGRIVVTGMGKSGHIGGKIAATLASTGSPAFFMHPGEASHGDVGMITSQDVVIAVSNSGETAEVVTLLPLLKRRGARLIAMTGKRQSQIARSADAVLDISVSAEACPLNLAPTASTTATLAMGDALALALLEARGFTAEDFALSHPAGALGRRLLLRVEDVMHGGDAVPVVDHTTTVRDALVQIGEKGLGMTAVVDENHNVVGVLTDGDLRRALDQRLDVHTTPVSTAMTHAPKTIAPQVLAAQAVAMMESHKITALLVVDEDQRLIGALNIHDLFRAGVV